MSEENVELVRQAIGAPNQRDLDTPRALNDPDIEVDWQGRDGIETAARSTLVFDVRGSRIAHIRLFQTQDEALNSAGLRE
jgi:hypothetical protein